MRKLIIIPIILMLLVLLVSAITIRETYKEQVIALDNAYAFDADYNDSQYRIAHRTITLQRQTALIEAGNLTNDYDNDTGLYELEWMALELKDGVQDIIPPKKLEHIYPEKNKAVNEDVYK